MANLYLADTFDRADSSSSLGTAPLGGAWTAHQGTWGTTGNYGYVSAHTNSVESHATLPNRIPDVTVRGGVYLSNNIVNRATAGHLVRYTDESNLLVVLLFVVAGYNAIRLSQTIAGSFTALTEVTSAGLVQGATYDVQTVVKDYTATVYVDGARRLGPTAFSRALTSYRAGLAAYKEAANYDDNGSAFSYFQVTDNVGVLRPPRNL